MIGRPQDNGGTWARCVLVGAALATVVAMTPRTVAAQADVYAGCTYEQCALRIRARFFGRDLVRGRDDEKVHGLGIWVGSLDDAFAGNPAAQELAASFGRRHNLGSTLVLLGGVTAAFAAALLASDTPGRDHGAATVATFGGLAALAVGGVMERSAEDRLSRAVWEYNRGLERP